MNKQADDFKNTGTLEKKQQIIRESEHEVAENNTRQYIMKPIICPKCSHVTWFDDGNVPSGEKYRMPCRNCGFVMIRKKA